MRLGSGVGGSGACFPCAVGVPAARWQHPHTHPSARPPALIGFSPRGAAPQRNAVFRSAPHLHTVSFAYRLFVVDCEVGHVTANKNILKQLNIEIPKKQTNKNPPQPASETNLRQQERVLASGR